MSQILFTMAAVVFVLGFWGMVRFEKPLHRLMSMGVWGSSFYLAFFGVMESL